MVFCHLLCHFPYFRWNELVGATLKIMDKFYMKLDKDSSNASINSSSRKLTSVLVKRPDESILGDLLNKRLRDGPQIKHLKIFGTELDLNNLKKTPELETLEVKKVKYTAGMDISLPELKTFKTKASDDILKFLRGTSKLTTLVIKQAVDRQALAHLINSGVKLESFSVRISENPNIFSDLTKPVKLKRLELRGGFTGAISVENHQNILDFFATQAETLQHLRTDRASSEVNQFTLSAFKNLKSLLLDVSQLTSEKAFYICDQPLVTVKELTLNGKFISHSLARLFMQKFPELVMLNTLNMECGLWTAKFLATVNKYQPKLQHLKFGNLYQGTKCNLVFAELKTFIVQKITTASIWMGFILANRGLETIEVTEKSSLQTSEIEAMLRLPELRHIKFSGGEEAIRSILTSLSADYKKLQTAELQVESTIPKQVKIIFPDSRQYWNPQQYEHIFD